MIGSWYWLPMALTGVLSAVGGWLTAYYTHRQQARTASGSIETSDARTLWEQAQRIIGELRTEVTRLTAEVARLEAANDRLDNENAALRRELEQLAAEIADLRAKVHS